MSSSIQRIEGTAFYSKAVIHAGTVYVSGVIPDDDSWDIKTQVLQVLTKIDGSLKSAGTDKSKLLNVNVYLVDTKDFAAMNEVYTSWIDPNNKPARTTVGATLPRPNIKVEISCVAAL